MCKNKTNIRIIQNKLSIFNNQIWIIQAFERQGWESAWYEQANTPPDRRAWQEQESSFCAVVWAEWPAAHFSMVCQQYSARSHPVASPTQRQADTHTTETLKSTYPTQVRSTSNRNATPLTESTHWQPTATAKAKDAAQIHSFVAVFQQHINLRPPPYQHEDY